MAAIVVASAQVVVDFFVIFFVAAMSICSFLVPTQVRSTSGSWGHLCAHSCAPGHHLSDKELASQPGNPSVRRCPERHPSPARPTLKPLSPFPAVPVMLVVMPLKPHHQNHLYSLLMVVVDASALCHHSRQVVPFSTDGGVFMTLKRRRI